MHPSAPKFAPYQIPMMNPALTGIPPMMPGMPPAASGGLHMMPNTLIPPFLPNAAGIKPPAVPGATPAATPASAPSAGTTANPSTSAAKPPMPGMFLPAGLPLLMQPPNMPLAQQPSADAAKNMPPVQFPPIIPGMQLQNTAKQPIQPQEKKES